MNYPGITTRHNLEQKKNNFNIKSNAPWINEKNTQINQIKDIKISQQLYSMPKNMKNTVSNFFTDDVTLINFSFFYY